MPTHYTSLALNTSDQDSSEPQRDTPQAFKIPPPAPTVEEIHTKTIAISVWLALLINIIIIGILSTAVFVPFKLTTFGPLTSHTKLIYLTGLTVLATICAAFSSAQIRHLWIQKIDAQLAIPGIKISAVNTRWRTALGVSSLSEGLQRWPITFSFLISGLITTAMVAGLSSTLAQRQEDYIYDLADSQDYSCTNTTQITPATSFNWLLANGSYYSVQANLDYCPGSMALTLLGAINNVDPENYGYADEGVAVHESALGAPASIYTSRIQNNEVFNSLIGVYGQSLLSTSQCVPVMTKNPITCSRSANATYDGQYLTITSPDGECVNSVPVGSSLTWADTSTVGQICSHGSLGQATIILGGIMSGCIYLAEAIGDSAWLDWWDSTRASTPESTYGITCTVDMAATLEYREVYLTLQQPTGSSIAYSRSLFASSSEPCTPVPYYSSESQNLDKLLAIATAATYQPLAVQWIYWARPFTIKNAFNGSWFVNTNYIRPAPYAFSNSRNALEDVLALTSALVLSRVTLTDLSGQIAYVGQKTIQYTRAGSGEYWAMVYVLPSLFVVIIIIALLFNSRSNPGFSSEQLSDLVGLRPGE